MKNICIIVGHARRGTFCEALGEAYMHGAAAAGHRARLFVLSRMKFDPVLHEGFSGVQPLETDLREAQDAIRWADHVVIIFPLWLGTLPAILKGFLERVLQLDFAFRADNSIMGYSPLLKGKSARIVITMGMPTLVYRWYFGAHALRMLTRNILNFVGIRPVRSTLFGAIGSSTDNKRRRWLLDMQGLGHEAA
jgi:NAD(P)H dehydrogenase (quinone)